MADPLVVLQRRDYGQRRERAAIGAAIEAELGNRKGERTDLGPIDPKSKGRTADIAATRAGFTKATRPDVAVEFEAAVKLGKKGGDRKSAAFKDQSDNVTSIPRGTRAATSAPAWEREPRRSLS